MESPVHVFMLSIQAVRGLPRLRAPGTVSCIISDQVSQMDGSSFTTHTHPFNGPFYGTTRMSRYQKGKTNLDFTEARDSEWQ